MCGTDPFFLFLMPPTAPVAGRVPQCGTLFQQSGGKGPERGTPRKIQQPRPHSLLEGMTPRGALRHSVLLRFSLRPTLRKIANPPRNTNKSSHNNWIKFRRHFTIVLFGRCNAQLRCGSCRFSNLDCAKIIVGINFFDSYSSS